MPKDTKKENMKEAAKETLELLKKRNECYEADDFDEGHKIEVEIFNLADELATYVLEQ